MAGPATPTPNPFLTEVKATWDKFVVWAKAHTHTVLAFAAGVIAGALLF